MATDPQRAFLRHALATLAYRGSKAIRGAPESFATFRAADAADAARTPLEILAHLGDLFDWAVSLAQGEPAWRDAEPGSWAEETERFFSRLQSFDGILASEVPLGFSLEQLFQGPVADALTHVGQIALLRRLAGAPIRGENYLKADIQTGRVTSEQAKPRYEFD
ncbi:MAG TPA: hypothetical protein VMM92_01065 [Thermoanaerobaculia bacterium]|nr:hypothetical protein [Thermoanaerobaculia bacterium]